MRSEDLLKYIGGVDDKYVDELMRDNVVAIGRRSANRKRWLAVAACFAVVFLCSAVLMGIGFDVDSGEMSLTGCIADIPMAHNAVVMIDVNPGIQMEVNDRGIVVKLEATNDDGAALVEELAVTGTDCQEAVKKIVSVLQENEYITNLKNSVLVSVANSDESFAESLRAAIVDTIQVLDDNTDYDLSILSQIITDISEYAEIAEQHSMSAGRAALIMKTCKAHEEFVFEQLEGHNIQTINQLFEYISLPELVERIGVAAATVPEECKEKLGIDGLNGEELLGFVSAISDFYNKLCEHYDVSYVANHIGYVFDIVCGQNENGEKLWAVVANSLTEEFRSRCAFFGIGDKSIGDWHSNSTFKDFVAYVARLAG